MPKIKLDERYYKKIDDYEKRFYAGEPNLLLCSSLNVDGDVVFGHQNTIRGDAWIKNNRSVPIQLLDRVSLSGQRQWG